MNVTIEYAVDSSVVNQNIIFAIAITDTMGNRLCYLSNEIVEKEIKGGTAAGRIRCRIDRLALMPDRYYLTLLCRVGSHWSDAVYEAVLFDVIGSDFYESGRMPPEGVGGNFLLDYAWID